MTRTSDRPTLPDTPQVADHLVGARAQTNPTNPEFNNVVQQAGGRMDDPSAHGFPSTADLIAALRDPEAAPAAKPETLPLSPAGPTPDTTPRSSIVAASAGSGGEMSFDLTCTSRTQVVISLCICR